jgi:hypothetical protein
MMHILLNSGAKVSLTGAAALESAIRGNHTDVASLLLNSGASVNAGMMETACRLGNLKLVKALDLRGVPASPRLLMLTMEAGHYWVFVCLLGIGVDFRYDNDVLLRTACKRNLVDFVKLLLDSTHQFSVASRNGFPSFHVPTEVADVHSDNEYPLSIAQAKGYHALGIYLISKGADQRLVRKLSISVKPAYESMKTHILQTQPYLYTEITNAIYACHLEQSWNLLIQAASLGIDLKVFAFILIEHGTLNPANAPFCQTLLQHLLQWIPSRAMLVNYACELDASWALSILFTQNGVISDGDACLALLCATYYKSILVLFHLEQNYLFDVETEVPSWFLDELPLPVPQGKMTIRRTLELIETRRDIE